MTLNLRMAEPVDAMALGLIFMENVHASPWLAEERRLYSVHSVTPTPVGGDIKRAIASRGIRGARVIVACLANRPVGYSVLCYNNELRDGARSNIRDCYISPSHHGKGIGSRLTRAAMALARREDWGQVVAETHMGNPRVIPLLRRLGFVRVVHPNPTRYQLYLAEELPDIDPLQA